MKNNKFLIIWIIIGVLLVGLISYKIYKDLNKDVIKEKLDTIGLYGYTIDENDTELYKSNFELLKKELKADEINFEAYAEYISKLFVIDLYTINNKYSSTDIGGLEFLHKDIKENFKEYVGNTLYNNVKINLDGNRNQELPVVKSVEKESIESIKYKYNDKEYDGYLVSLKWEYEKDLGYQNNLKITLIKDSDILYIVKGE